MVIAMVDNLLFSIENQLGKTYKKKSRRRLQVIKGKIYKLNSPLRFLGKCASGSLISARPLCPVDDAIDRSSNAIA